MLLRQGDLLIATVDAIPSDATPVERERGRCVLAKGETTGHEHAVPEPNVEHFRSGDKQYLDVGAEGASLVHEEHGTIDLEPGKHEITVQREYEPTSRGFGGSRMVYD